MSSSTKQRKSDDTDKEETQIVTTGEALGTAYYYTRDPRNSFNWRYNFRGSNSDRYRWRLKDGFPLFSELPIELRLKIYDYAMPKLGNGIVNLVLVEFWRLVDDPSIEFQLQCTNPLRNALPALLYADPDFRRHFMLTRSIILAETIENPVIFYKNLDVLYLSIRALQVLVSDTPKDVFRKAAIQKLGLGGGSEPGNLGDSFVCEGTPFGEITASGMIAHGCEVPWFPIALEDAVRNFVTLKKIYWIRGNNCNHGREIENHMTNILEIHYKDCDLNWTQGVDLDTRWAMPETVCLTEDEFNKVCGKRKQEKRAKRVSLGLCL